MGTVKKIGVCDIYLTVSEIVKKFTVNKKDIYKRRNENKIRRLHNTIRFNVDDLMELMKEKKGLLKLNPSKKGFGRTEFTRKSMVKSFGYENIN